MCFRLRRYPFVFLALAILAPPLKGQDRAEFDEQLRGAIESADDEVVGELVRANRLDVLPFVRAILDEGARARLGGDHSLFDRTLASAISLGRLFEKIYGERSVSILASHYASWTDNQLRIKQVADSLQVEGTSKRANRDTRDLAFTDYERALELYKEIGDEPGEATVLGGLGYVAYYKDGQLALDYNTQALEMRRRVDDRLQIGNALNTIALVYRVRLKNLEAAIDYYAQARVIREEIGDYRGLGRTLAFLGDMLYRDFGRLEEALENFLSAYEVDMIAGDSARAASALNVTGTLMVDLGRYSEALEPLNRSREMRMELGDLEGAAAVTNNLGIAYRRLGDFDAAIESYQTVVQFAREDENTELEAQALNNIAVVFIWAERPERVISFAERAKTAYENIGSMEGVLSATINLGSAQFELRKYESARSHAEMAVALADSLEDRIRKIESLNLLANVQNRTGNYDQAIENYEQALEIAEYMSLPDQIFAAILGLGEVYERSGEYERAIAHYEEAFALLERTRSELETGEDKSGFFKQQRYAFEAYVHFLSKLYLQGTQGMPAMRAFLVAERAKARTFLDELSASIAGVQGGVADELLEEQNDNLRQIAEMRGNIQYEAQFSDADQDAIARWREALGKLEDQFADLQRRIRTENPRYADLHYPEPSSIENIQANILDEDTALFAYAVGDSSTTLWVLTSETTDLFVLPGRSELVAKVDAFRFALTDPTRADEVQFTRTSFALYEALIKPAKSYVDDAVHLIIVPDGILSYVPFEALVQSETVSKSFSEMPFLLNDVSISYAQSASVLDRIISDRDSRTAQPDRDLLAFGDPVFAASNLGELVSPTIGRSGALFEPLPFSGIEVQSISDLFEPDRIDVYVRDDARESVLKERIASRSYRFLHLATHGLIDEEEPDFSSIVLTTTDDDGQDGFLLAAEIFNLELDVDLVVLSACETGLGQMIKGEGIVGLTRAFMYAGAPSLVVSLWKVADESTSQLMELFYNAMVQQNASKVKALRDAKLQLISVEELAHPFHWAPFVLVGDWK